MSLTDEARAAILEAAGFDLTVRYCLHPEKIRARDGQWRQVTFGALLRLYGLEPQQCVNYDHLRGRERLGKMIHLYPREDGNYELTEEQSGRRR